ncbi:MinD/ParA family protein [Allosphingosinicella flava]|uniref:MinD/ParA family protein n=1 Tax=Allosphingosinicella flava TaxID=2771430 RepID=A0A7T2LMA7_9SPHN|nr:MinD/ParA family protein [Sphingosinicella flava]QPQ55346.1 MinD/ParA family protein [Sphingosinicella flava]
MMWNSVRKVRIVAVASGKGGVGKTNCSVNLAVALARLGKATMLVDADIGLANANILLGLNAPLTVGDVLARQCGLSDIIIEGPAGLKIVPGHNGSGVTAHLDRSDRRRLADVFRPYASTLDYLVLDTGTGIAPEALRLTAMSDLVTIVLSGEPTAFMDAYTLTKVLALDHGITSLAVVTNMVDDEGRGRELFRHFRDVVSRFLPTDLLYLGSVPNDDHVRKAVLRKQCCIEAFPRSQAAQAFGLIAHALAELDPKPRESGDRFFGMEALHGAR